MKDKILDLTISESEVLNEHFKILNNNTNGVTVEDLFEDNESSSTVIEFLNRLPYYSEGEIVDVLNSLEVKEYIWTSNDLYWINENKFTQFYDDINLVNLL